MAQLGVRNPEDEVKIRLQRRARRHGRSAGEEVRDILRNAVKDENAGKEPLGSRIRARFAGLGLAGGARGRAPGPSSRMDCLVGFAFSQ